MGDPPDLPDVPAGAVTRLLKDRADGDPEALSKLFEMVYGELRRIARSRRRKQATPLDTTELVHEAYVRLASPGGGVARDRSHFLAVAALAMRHVVVDLARTRGRDKRGGDRRQTDLASGLVTTEEHAERVLAVDQALRRLEADEPRLATVVECRYFAGFSETETAEVLGVTARTVQRDWRRARQRLAQALR